MIGERKSMERERREEEKIYLKDSLGGKKGRKRIEIDGQIDSNSSYKIL